VGDRVIIEETRPLSKEKRWRIPVDRHRANPAARLTTSDTAPTS